jgi:hypothetical protein
MKPVAPDSSRTSDKIDPLLAGFKRQTASLDVGEASNRWQDKDKLGNLDVGVYASADDARKGFAAFNAFSRGWGARSGHITKDEEIDGLGDEAWVLWVAGYATQVTYHWRRSNLVIEAHIHCFGLCPRRRRCSRACTGRRDRRGSRGSAIGSQQLLPEHPFARAAQIS